jgi:hypothetical protein
MDELTVGMIATFHLSNGQTIIAKIEGEDEDGFQISKPMQFIMRDINGQLAVALTPFLSMGKIFPEIDVMVLPYLDILLPRKTPDALEQQYREETGMLVTPPQSLIVTA